ncbi:type I-E CRISPR-associated protein Cas6/Cse3/CasE [Bifidobacterium sp. ESL0798]|uniref:type I-E CRISPR-associated protein Cas6/Cse3/CasE n=1 Tax=Bifidobacterium sp. ESL0798 TaxID=2983235 RepID=UPI0023F9FB20|nr:type I-E CRISPR-associated protein Cas6/Cse3/CasE [Bifidobacterium sp. ESL0798]WEV73651.1 type I-E CRISPR-associated protein Cas6/Cse3/CasE [Bifidobacterium sp. ESL0798]
MFISRIPLNAGRYGAQHLISSPYRMHAAVEACFPPGVARQTEEGRILWRLDFNEEAHSVWLYVVSPAKPDFTHIVEQAGWPMYQEWQSKDYAPVLSRIHVGARFNFRLRANPVHKVGHDKFAGKGKPQDGKRLGHVTVEQQSQWLIDRSESNGFSVLQHDGDYQLVVSQRKKESASNAPGRALNVKAMK